MIVGVGSDLVAIHRIQGALERFGERFTRRIFLPQEVARCTRTAQRAACLAKRFAAKEALVKALGTGMRDGIWFTDIQVVTATGGQPGIRLQGEARRCWESLGSPTIHLSLSDDAGFALAFVVLAKEQFGAGLGTPPLK